MLGDEEYADQDRRSANEQEYSPMRYMRPDQIGCASNDKQDSTEYPPFPGNEQNSNHYLSW